MEKLNHLENYTVVYESNFYDIDSYLTLAGAKTILELQSDKIADLVKKYVPRDFLPGLNMLGRLGQYLEHCNGRISYLESKTDYSNFEMPEYE
jgi:hypothetical protein